MSIFASADLKMRLFRSVVAQGIFVFFLLLLCLQIISFSVVWWRGNLKAVTKTTPMTMPVVQQQGQDKLKLLWPLFGEYFPKQFGDMNIKRSALNLQVVGILFSTQAKDSQVILRAVSGEDQFYKIGDTLPGGAVLKQISSDGVLMMRHGELESLSLPKDKLIFDPPLKRLFPL